MLSKLKLLGAGVIAVVFAWLKISEERSKADAADARADLEGVKAAGAKTQLDQLNRAQEAARNAGAGAQQEVDDVEDKVKRGDLSGMDNNF